MYLWPATTCICGLSAKFSLDFILSEIVSVSELYVRKLFLVMVAKTCPSVLCGYGNGFPIGRTMVPFGWPQFIFNRLDERLSIFKLVWMFCFVQVVVCLPNRFVLCAAASDSLRI